MKLSYSKYSTYLDCPRLFKFQRDRVDKTEEDDKYFALYGLLIESFFKDYVNSYLPKKVILDESKIKSILRKKWNKIIRENVIEWDQPWKKQTDEDIFLDVYEDTLANIKEFDFWKDCRSEVTFEVYLKKSGDFLTCRMDFVRDIGNGEVEILDGKGTKHMDRPNEEQLLFYALLYYLRHKKLPKRLGFLYYRYQVIKYIEFNQDILITFKNKLAMVKKAIKIDKKFEPKLKLTKVCRFCMYKGLCDVYIERQEKNQKKNQLIDNYNGEIFYLE